MLNARFSSKEKIGLIIALLFFSSAVLDWAIVEPVNKKIKKINQEIKVSQAQLTFDLSNVAHKDEIAKEFEKYASYQKASGSDEENITMMLSVLEDLGRDSGLTFLDIKPQQPDKTDLFKKYTIAIETEGTMEELVQFLYKLDNSEHLLRVEKLRLSTRDKAANQLKSSIVVTKIFIL